MTDLLLIVPHPDDEVFGCGGLFIRMATHGKKVATLTLTRGGAGRTLGLCSQAQLPELREAELRKSLEVLGVSQSFIWDYPDYLPDSSRDLSHREGLQAEDAEVLSGRISEVISDLKPRSILTFPPNGSNGHPDHSTTHRLVLLALAQSEHQPQKLFYFAGDKPYSAEARPGFLAPSDIAAQHLYPTHYVRLEHEIEAKLRAMGQHKTQALSVLMFMERFPRRLLEESFHQARPNLAEQIPQTVLWL